jgi:hypothetical protein
MRDHVAMDNHVAVYCHMPRQSSERLSQLSGSQDLELHREDFDFSGRAKLLLSRQCASNRTSLPVGKQMAEPEFGPSARFSFRASAAAAQQELRPPE